ncbi:TetR/AcrR family transcriptional regulator [Nocardia australiensis]|uniref:TetR/AcrR family transcriptional regulator n=1 Tax=Nocardia australiensis TaxID=2887191 RepID=UPI001D1418E2|nr:TetR/AcrR family transcriptional regulator [Nocardia australiensis]
MTISEAQERARSARKDSAGPRRTELLDAAARCFAEHGYDHTSVETITTRAQVSRATFYAYFSSKDEVFRAITEQVCTQFLDAQLVVNVEATEPIEVIGATTRAFADAVFANGALVALIEHRAGVDPTIGALWSQVRIRLRRRFTAFLEGVEDRGEIDPCAPLWRIVETLSDALLIGASRLADADHDAREQFVADHIAIAERLIGFTR